MDLLKAIFLGILQGATEFLPISSSGHLVLVPWLLGWEKSPLIFDVAVHLGTLLAVLVYFWRDWLALGERTGKAVQIFRLSGIYGPGRNPIVKLRTGTATRLVKQGQVFNRIHVDDIAGILMASIAAPRPGAVYNVTDDEPAPPQDVVVHAATLAGLTPPPETPFDPAKLSPMAASFYGENKRVSNALVKREFGYAFRYPTYREALPVLLAGGD